MARETRRQRRDARREAGLDSGPSQRASRARIGGTPVAADGPIEAQVEPYGRRRRGTFVRESYAELRKVEWPNRSQVIQGTVVVIIACAIVGAYLWGADQVLRRVVQNVFIG
jgi:preprotein translocase SecE subunit